MTTITIPISELPNRLHAMGFELKKQMDGISKTYVRRTAEHLATMARKFAPVQSGDLKAGISLVWNGGKPVVYSTVPRDWPYNAWVDVRKGITSHGRLYPSVRKTGIKPSGKGGYFYYAGVKAREYGKNVVINRLKKISLVGA